MQKQKQNKSKQTPPPTNEQYRSWLRDRSVSDDAAFAEYVSGLVFPRHLREMEQFLTKNPRALVLMPRGHAKTTQLIHRAARLVGVTEGKIRIGIVTSVLSDALARSRAIKTIVESAKFAEIFPWARNGVAGGKWTDEVWTIKGVNLGKDATCFADGLTSIKPGPRLDLLIADDIVGLKENATPTQRQKASETYWQVIDPMLVPGATRWYIGTRWHEDDFYAELTSKGIPTYLRRSLEDQGPLWPDMYTVEDLERKREELGTPIFNLQYQNDVTSMGGNIFRYEFFKYVDSIPPGARRVGVDLAASEKERSDYTAAVEVVEDDEHNLYVVGAYRTRIQQGHQRWLTGVDRDGSIFDDPSSPKLLWPAKFVGLKGQRDVWGEEPRRLTEVNVEVVQYQSTFVRELINETRLPARGVRPERDKVFRSRSLAARYEAGKVFHLKGGPGIRQLESEMMSFPNSEHDDLVDALVYAADVGNSGFYFTAAKRS
jgi:predicted phage terminase large subunit-like protein